MSKHFTVTNYDQQGSVVSLDTISTDSIVRTRYFVDRRALLLVINEPFESEDIKTVPTSFDKKGVPTNLQQKKVTNKGLYVQSVTDPDEIKTIYKLLTEADFKGLELSDEYQKKMDEALKVSEMEGKPE